MDRLWRTGLAALLLPMLLALIAQRAPAQGRAMSTEDLIKHSDLVVVGKVADLKSEWSSDRSRIFTRVTLGVDQYLKGQGTGPTISIMTPGGEIGDVGEIYSHMPTFHKEENVVLFVEKDAQGSYRVTGGSQGKLMIEKDDKSGRLFVAGQRTLEDFVQSVQKTVDNQRAK